MIEFKSVENLERDKDQKGLYDLYTTFFINNKSVFVFGYKVQRGESMKINTICNKIYNNYNHLSFLLDLNNILNPLTIKEGDLLLYVKEDDIPNFTAPAEEGKKIRDKVINNAISSKKQNANKSRKDYIKKRTQSDPLPPNIKQNTSKSLTIDNGVIKIVLDKDQSV